jgi:hypothetical protein
VKKYSILGLFTLSLVYLLSSMTITPSEVRAIEFDFGGKDGFHFDLGSFPGSGEQGPPEEHGPKGDKGDTGAQGPQGEKGDKGDTGATGPGVEYGHVIVFVHVTDNTGEGYVASDIPIVVIGNHQTLDSFQGSETGTDVKLGFGSYQISYGFPDKKNPALPPPQLMVDQSDGCFRVIHPDETKTCTMTFTINP